MAQKLRKHGKKMEKTSVGCHIDFTILLSMLKVKFLMFQATIQNRHVFHSVQTAIFSAKRTILNEEEVF